ncbi:MAG TPA: hypothetical protein VJR92_02345 [Gemmatimonadaceae bacterium]|nr:hypothetical protein [Gemmatimonadaceae bacterium]
MRTVPIAPRLVALTAAFTAVAGVACSSDSTSANAVVQMTAADASPKTVRCAGGAVPDSMVWDLHLVNTTDEDVPVVSVASAGTIIRSSNTALVGNSIAVVPDVPFTPDSAILMAKRGDREIRAMLPNAPFCAQAAQWKDVYVSMRVVVGNWQVASQWVEIAVR